MLREKLPLQQQGILQVSSYFTHWTIWYSHLPNSYINNTHSGR